MEQKTGLRQQLRRVAVHCLASPAIPAEVISGLSATAADFRDDQVSVLAWVLVRNIVDGACPETDLAALADHLKQLTLVSDPRYVSPKMYVSLAILENHIERYPQALAYSDALLARSPDSVRGMMMKLYFTSVLQLGDEHQSMLGQLQHLEAQGLLNRQQQFNLGLFTATEADSQIPE